jgi:hypothetical protein
MKKRHVTRRSVPAKTTVDVTTTAGAKAIAVVDAAARSPNLVPRSSMPKTRISTTSVQAATTRMMMTTFRCQAKPPRKVRAGSAAAAEDAADADVAARRRTRPVPPKREPTPRVEMSSAPTIVMRDLPQVPTIDPTNAPATTGVGVMIGAAMTAAAMTAAAMTAAATTGAAMTGTAMTGAVETIAATVTIAVAMTSGDVTRIAAPTIAAPTRSDRKTGAPMTAAPKRVEMRTDAPTTTALMIVPATTVAATRGVETSVVTRLHDRTIVARMTGAATIVAMRLRDRMIDARMSGARMIADRTTEETTSADRMTGHATIAAEIAVTIVDGMIGVATTDVIGKPHGSTKPVERSRSARCLPRFPSVSGSPASRISRSRSRSVRPIRWNRRRQ